MLNLPELPLHDWTRLPYAIAVAINELDEEDRAERIAHCEQTGERGTFVDVDDDGVLRFSWGGRPLFAMHRNAFLRSGATPGELS